MLLNSFLKDSGGASPYLVFKSLEIRVCTIIFWSKGPRFYLLQPGNDLVPFVDVTILVTIAVGGGMEK